MRYIFFICFAAIASCSNNTGADKSLDSLQAESSTHPADEVALTDPDKEGIEGCYLMILQRDTMVLHLQSSMKISGKLTFDNYEKDGSSGMVTGIKEGDVLKLKYAFASEGMNSVMDVHFKIAGDTLIRGVGEMQTKGDTAYFANPAEVQFTGKDYFIKTPCENLAPKYRL